MRTAECLAVLAVSLMLAGCIASPARHAGPGPAHPEATDIDFVHGCWVAKRSPGGDVLAFLRLLPEGAIGPDYRGAIIDVSDGGWTPGDQLAFSRDGATLTTQSIDGTTTLWRRIDVESSLEPLATQAAAYGPEYGEAPILIAEGDAQRLIIRSRSAGSDTGGDNVWFSGERDGCD